MGKGHGIKQVPVKWGDMLENLGDEGGDLEHKNSKKKKEED